MMNLPPIMIIGTGAQREIAGGREFDVEVVLIDKTLQGGAFPSLFQVQSEPGEETIGEILERSGDDHFVMMGQVKAILKGAKEIHLANGDIVHYNHLIVANGSRHTYIAHESLDEIRHGVSALVDALKLRKMILRGLVNGELGAGSVVEKSSRNSKVELTNAVKMREKEEGDVADSFFKKMVNQGQGLKGGDRDRLAELLSQLDADILYEVQL